MTLMIAIVNLVRSLSVGRFTRGRLLALLIVPSSRRDDAKCGNHAPRALDFV